MYYYFYTTANSDSKDFFSVISDHKFDVSLHKVNRYFIRKPTEVNDHSLMFSLKTTLPVKASCRPSLLWPNVWIPTFYKERWGQMLFVRDVPGSEWCALWARHYTLLLISLRSRSNWLFILEYFLVLVAIYLVNGSLKCFNLLHLSGVDRNILAYSRIILFLLLPPKSIIYKWVWRNLDCCK